MLQQKSKEKTEKLEVRSYGKQDNFKNISLHAGGSAGNYQNAEAINKQMQEKKKAEAEDKAHGEK